MPKPIKILHVLGRLGRGGAEMRALEILQHVDRRQYQLHFCALSGESDSLDDEIRALGSKVHLLRRGLLGFPRRFRALLRQDRFDVVHSQVLYYSGFILRLAAQCSVPIRVAQFHNTHDSRRSTPGRRMLRALLRRMIDHYATNIVAVSEGVMTAIWGPHWKVDPRCSIVYNGVAASASPKAAERLAVRHEFGLPADTPLCIHVGRMAQQKNHLRLISMFFEVWKHCPASRLLLVGRGGNEIEQRIRGQIAAWGIQEHVIICGERDDVPRLLSAADVLVFPSLWEGLPGAVQEACVAGTPVVASDLPGTREIAVRLPGIRLLALAASDQQWAQAITTALTKRKSHDSQVRARRAFEASPFTIDRCAEINCRIWRGLTPKPLTGGAVNA